MTASEFGPDVRDYVSGYIRFADAKAGALLTILTFMVGGLTAGWSSMLAQLEGAPMWCMWLTFALSLISAASTALTIWHSVVALSPRAPRAKTSLASFPDIAAMDTDQYLREVLNASDHQIRLEYAALNSTLSRVAASKFESVGRAMCWLRCALLSTYGLTLIYLWLVAAQFGD